MINTINTLAHERWAFRDIPGRKPLASKRELRLFRLAVLAQRVKGLLTFRKRQTWAQHFEQHDSGRNPEYACLEGNNTRALHLLNDLRQNAVAPDDPQVIADLVACILHVQNEDADHGRCLRALAEELVPDWDDHYRRAVLEQVRQRDCMAINRRLPDWNGYGARWAEEMLA